MEITIEELKNRLESAAYVMRLLPPVKVQGFVTMKLEIVYSAQEIGLMEKRQIKITPSGEQITEMEETLSWLDILEPIERKLVWKRANRIPWKVLSYEFGYHRSKLTEKYNLSMAKILVFLNFSNVGTQLGGTNSKK